MTICQVLGPGEHVPQCERIALSIYPHVYTGMNRTVDRVEAGQLILLVATDGDDVVGFGTLGGLHLPRRMVRIYVDPRHTKRGIGAALIAELLAQVPPGVPAMSLVGVNDPRSVAFAERYGFNCDDDSEYEVELVWQGPSALPPAPSHVSPLGAWAAEAGYDTLVPLIDAAATELPMEDNLPRDGDDPLPFLLGLDQQLSAVSLTPDGQVRGFTLVRPEPKAMNVIMTYVAPRSRRNAVARALKTHTLNTVAPDTWVTTECMRSNTPIRQLNLALGFRDVSRRIVERPAARTAG